MERTPICHEPRAEHGKDFSDVGQGLMRYQTQDHRVANALDFNILRCVDNTQVPLGYEQPVRPGAIRLSRDSNRSLAPQMEISNRTKVTDNALEQDCHDFPSLVC
jgi:hypothetical protein